VVATLKKGDKVTIIGLGAFSVSSHAARIGRNPQTGELLKIKARKMPKFKARKVFANKVAACQNKRIK